jgi:hypothetical protein
MNTKKKPDRWDTLVQHRFNANCNPIKPLIRLEDCADMLRREHRAVLRLIQRHRRAWGDDMDSNERLVRIGLQELASDLKRRAK